MRNIISIAKSFEEKIKKPNGAGILFSCSYDNTVLLLLRSNKVSEPGTWGLPGGAVEQGETFKQAAKREAIEEIVVLPSAGTIINTISNDRGGWKYVIYVIDIYYSEKISWSKYITLNEENTKFEWFKMDNIPNNLHSPIKIIR